MVGRERFELCRPGHNPVLDPTVISRVLLGLKPHGFQMTKLSHRPTFFAGEGPEAY